MMPSPQLTDVKMLNEDFICTIADSKDSKPEHKQDIDMDKNASNSLSASTPVQGHKKTPSLRRSSRRRTLAPIYYQPGNSAQYGSNSSSSSSNSTISNYSSSPNVRKVINENSVPIRNSNKTNITQMVTIDQKNNKNDNRHSNNQENIPPASSPSIPTSLMSQEATVSTISTPTETTIVPKKIATISSLTHKSCTSSSNYFNANDIALPQIKIHPATSEKETNEGCKPSLSSLSSSSSDMNSLCNAISTRINIQQGIEYDETHHGGDVRVSALAPSNVVATASKRQLRRSQRIKRKNENKHLSSSRSLSSSSVSSSSSMSISNASSLRTKKRKQDTYKLGEPNENEKCCHKVSVSASASTPVQNSHHSGEVLDTMTTKNGDEEENDVSKSSRLISSVTFDSSHKLDVQNSRGTTLNRTQSGEGIKRHEENVSRNTSILFSDDDGDDNNNNNNENIQLSKNKKPVSEMTVKRRRRSLRRRNSINLPERYRDENTFLYLKPPSKNRKDMDSPSNSLETKSSTQEQGNKNSDPAVGFPGISGLIPRTEKIIIPTTVNLEDGRKKLVVQRHVEDNKHESSHRCEKDVDTTLRACTDYNCLSVTDERMREESNREQSLVLTQENLRTEPVTSSRNLPKKRRRRSSMGLHTGGFISLTDIEKIGKEAATRQRRRSCDTNGISSVIVEDGEDSSYSKADQLDVLDKVGLLTTIASCGTDTTSPNDRNGAMIPVEKKIHSCDGRKVGNDHHAVDPESHEQCIPKAHEIKTTIAAMFHFGEVFPKPCMSARIFSCAILLEKQRMHSKDSFEMLLPLFQAFVKAELASLMDTNAEYVRAKKRVHFCSIDNSSIFTPVDTEKGSERIIETCISSTYEVLKEIDDLRDEVNYVSHISVLTSALEDIISSSHLLLECSKAMPCQWPTSRLAFAAKYYLQELNFICFGNEKSSGVRYTLGDSIGRAIRFYLRRFFNPVPVSLHTYSDAKQPNYDFSRSNVHKIIELTDIEGQQDTAVADGSISSVISLALLRIHEFFELSNSNTQCNGEAYISSFCNRPASQNGLQKEGSTIILNDNDIDEILLDISESHIVLSGIRACKFFHTVMTWPGVSKAIDDVGGWDKIEYYAQMFMECKLDKDVPDEMHFQHLASVALLIKKIDKDFDLLCKLEKECHGSLRRMWKRFRCGTRKKEVLRLNPGIRVIQKYLKAGGDTYFPSVTNC